MSFVTIRSDVLNTSSVSVEVLSAVFGSTAPVGTVTVAVFSIVSALAAVADSALIQTKAASRAFETYRFSFLGAPYQGTSHVKERMEDWPASSAKGDARG